MKADGLLELVGIAVAAVVHVGLEAGGQASVARMWNVLVCVLFLGYVGWRVVRSRAVLEDWGIRLDNLRPALLAQAAFVALASLALVAYGRLRGHEPRFEPLLLPLYLVWGIAQQFALQNLLVRNLIGLVRPRLLVVPLAAALFGAVHVPRLELAVLAFAAGLPLTWIHQRTPNLLATGLAHGILGAAVFTLVLDSPWPG